MRNLKRMNGIGLVLVGFGLIWAADGLAVTLTGPERYSSLLEYVSADGGQTIDTGMKLSSDMTVSAVFSINAQASGATGIFGSRATAASKNISCGIDANGLFADFNDSNHTPYRIGPDPIETGVKYRVDISAAGRTLTRLSDDTVVLSNTEVCPNVFECDRTAHLFYINGTSDWGRGKLKLYSLTVSRGGKVLLDYAPCLLDGKARLFEKVSATYPVVTCSGATDLSAGPVIGGSEPQTVEPSTRTARVGLSVEHLSSGESPVDVYALSAPFAWGYGSADTFVGTSFAERYTDLPHVDLGYALTQDMSIDLTFSIEATEPCASLHGVLGSRGGASSQNIGVSFYGKTKEEESEFLYLDFNNSDYSKYRVTYQASSVRHKVYRAQLSARQRVLTDVATGTVLAENLTPCPDTIETSAAWLFNMNGTSYGCSMNVHGLTIRRGDTVLHDYRPVVLNGVKGLVDCVTMTLVKDAADPDFVAGSALPTVQKVVEDVAADGTYTGDLSELTPGAECWYALLLTGGTDRGYATWACEEPHSFMTQNLGVGMDATVEPSDRTAQVCVEMERMALAEKPVDVYGLYAPFAWGVGNADTFVGTSFAWRETNLPSVDLGFPLTQDMSIDLTFSIEATEPCASTHGIFGARNGASSHNVGVAFYGKSGEDGTESLYLDFNNSQYSDYRVTYQASSVRHKVYRAQLSARQRVLTDVATGTVLAENPKVCPDAITTSSAMLFGMNGLGYACSVNVYALTIRRGDLTLHDYKPLVIGGVTGLVDCVTMTMVKNAAEADFAAGSAIPAAQKILSELTADGTYTGELSRPRLKPETEYRYGLLATGGIGLGYATWACETPQTFTTLEKIPRGMTLFLR